ncbi:K(+)-transporting ATPase subunit C [Labrys neptuniae]
MFAQLRAAVLGTLLLGLITGAAYPLVLLGAGRWLFPAQAEGSLLQRDEGVVGSRLIGQAFSEPGYFHLRPSAAGAGYDATASGGSNFAPSNPKLIDDVGKFAAAYRQENALSAAIALPIDAVTRSGSGLDPHISPENATLQLARVARVRGLDEARLRRLVADYSEGRQFGVLGQPRVAVLELNLALDRLAPLSKAR